MGNALDLDIANSEAIVNQLLQSNNIDKITLASDKGKLPTLDPKTYAELTHREKKYIYRTNNYYNVTYEPLEEGGGGEIPDGADGIVDFINGFYDLGSGPVGAETIISDPAAITSNGLDFNLLTNTANILGELLSVINTVDYTIVIEWEETEVTPSGQEIIFSVGSGNGAFPTDYMILQNIGGTHPNQIYFYEALDSETNNRDVISSFAAEEQVDVGINKIAVGIDATDIQGAVNGAFLTGEVWGGGPRTGGRAQGVSAFAGWRGAAKSADEQRVRSVTFYPTTFDQTTLEGYSAL